MHRSAIPSDPLQTKALSFAEADHPSATLGSAANSQPGYARSGFLIRGFPRHADASFSKALSFAEAEFLVQLQDPRHTGLRIPTHRTAVLCCAVRSNSAQGAFLSGRSLLGATPRSAALLRMATRPCPALVDPRHLDFRNPETSGASPGCESSSRHSISFRLTPAHRIALPRSPIQPKALSLAETGHLSAILGSAASLRPSSACYRSAWHAFPLYRFAGRFLTRF